MTKRKSEPVLATARRKKLCRVTIALAAAGALQLTHVHDAFAVNYSVHSQGATLWTSGGNWTNTTTQTTGTVPGANDVAEFDTNPTSVANLGFNFTVATNNGSANQIVGTLAVTASRSNALTLGPYTGSGILTLNGTTINGQANTILSNFDSSAASGTLTLANYINTNTTGTMGVALNNTVNYVQLAGGSGSTAGDQITIISNITEVNALSSFTLLGGGNATNNGGIVDLSGTNTFTGGITVGDTLGTAQAGVLQVDTTTALPTTGNIVINPNSSLVLNAASGVNTFGGTGQTLTISGNGAPGTLGAVRTLGTTETAVWAGTLSLAGNSQIDTAQHLSTLNLSGAVVDNGHTLTKSGLGTLIFSSASNSFGGGTSISNGTLIVNSGSSMASGAVSLSCPAGTSTTTATSSLFLNNTTQTIGSLSDSFSTSAYPQAVTLNLNGTALTINQTSAGTFGNGTASYSTGIISGSGSITLASTSTAALELSSTNTYGGSTTVNGGTLQLLSTGALTGGGPIAVNAGLLQVNAGGAISGAGAITVNGGSLGGGGSVAGPVTINAGTLFEGGLVSAVGTLTTSSSVTLTNAATLKIKVQGPNSAAGQIGDVVVLNGANQVFTVGGAALQLVSVSGSTFQNATFPYTYTIVDATGGTGNTVNYATPFAGLANGAQYTDGAGDTYSVTYLSNAIDLTLYSVAPSAVPEPASLALFAIGGLGLLRRRRQSRRAMSL